MTDIPLIELSKINKVYGKKPNTHHALKGIDIAVNKGEFAAVMGPSGSGKSTMMNILGCLDIPTSGSYRFQGVRLETLSRSQRALVRRYQFGFVFQGFNLLSRTTAIENIELPLIYRKESYSSRRQKALFALDQVGLTGWQKHLPSELSGGQQQRIAIARAIVCRPSVLLADEPTGNLDTSTSHEIMKLLTTLNREHNFTIIMVTHEMDMAQYASRIILFRDGLIERDYTGEKK
ncbi:MAG: ABC transporter ATP-binding protein [Deltaproteobacteria bacterium]|nr:ABC transporter ATP-binding protein [Deltaproteobacteria bacterium]